ncbi:bacterial low temperature requirement A protein-domain-containing protein [Pyrenochaeta sp. MPI-SDFR-AT-0127]|nr:bacterial low temperature requirement A protein-domain-containing protein [Pyrenochaeta sp. MPI-SDFR-AT-0127]
MSDTPQTLIGGNDTPASVKGASPGHHHHHLHHTGKRLKQFLRSDGRKVHIASSPDEANHLRKTLSSAQEKDDFDLVIHGSPEHIEALRHTHAHHEDRHKKLKEEHGDLALEFERVIRELDALSNELHMISEHAVQLDANFSKYGYSAHLRTKEGPESLHSSGESTFDKETWHAERKLGETMRFYQKPIVRQYFHKGLLWRAKEAQEVASYELFIDLFYVGIIAITGDTAAEHPTGESLLRFAITFIMGWKFWSDIGLLISWFDSDDVLRRCSVLFILTCLLGFTTNMASAFEHTYTPLVAFYLAARMFMTVSMFWYAWSIPMVRGSMIGNGIISLIPAALWIGSIHVEEPAKQGLIWVAIVFDLFGNFIMIFIQRPGPTMAKIIPAKIKESLEFFPGNNIEHRIERTNAFVTLVFGSCVLGLLYQSNVEMGINAFFGKAVLGLIQAFVFNWLYFEIDSFNLHTHAIRRHVFSALTWFSVHLPFIMSFVLSASALAVLVRAHDCPDAPLDSLFETFIPRSEDHISDGLQWFYCGGLGISLFCLSIIALSHTHRKIPNQRLRKESRLAFRVAVSIVIICLPKAHLNSLQLVATATGLVVCVLVVELVGMSCWGENIFWEKNCRRAQASYEANCAVRREELEKSVKEGKVLNVEEIARKEKGGMTAQGGITAV